MLKNVTLFLVLVIFAGAVLGALYFWNQVNWPVSSVDEQVNYSVPQGNGVKAIAADLATQGLIRSAFWFEAYVYIERSENRFIAGTYSLNRQMSIREIAKVMTAGTNVEEQTITIREGLSIREIAAYLQESGILDSKDFLAAAAVTDTRTIIPGVTYDYLSDKPQQSGLEGYLFPDTYRIFAKATPAHVIEKMLDNFGTKYTDQMRQDTVKGNMSIYEIVTLASILEKEIKINRGRDGQPVNTDLNIAAGVFYNRLKIGKGLESDATVNYVTGKSTDQPSSEDVAIDNPYNTYKYAGLPPGPICNPSIDAIKAAIYPEKTDYFYFLTKPDGTTVFSKTYEEHLANKRKYLP